MTAAFDRACTLRELEPGRFAVAVDESWQQGRGAYGGLVSAWLVRAAERVASDRPARGLTLHLCAPVLPGEAEVALAVARAGSAVTHVGARVLQEGATVAFGGLTLSRDRDLGVDFATAAPPTAPPPDSQPAAPWVPMMPAFARHFEFRFALGDLPFTGSPVALSGGWLRLVEPVHPDRAMVAAMVDSWPPGLFSRLDGPRPVGTVVMETLLFGAPREREEHCLVVSRSEVVAEGLCAEDDEVWSSDGRLLARMHQLLAVIR